MRKKGIKPHVQPVRLNPPEPVKRLGAQPAWKKTAEMDPDEGIIQENIPVKDGAEAGLAAGEETDSQEQAE